MYCEAHDLSNILYAFTAAAADLEYGRYKYIVQVMIGERREQGVR